jgi:hypothetical protein
MPTLRKHSKQKKSNVNVQPGLLIQLMMQSEPDFFSNKLELMPVAITRYPVEDVLTDFSE